MSDRVRSRPWVVFGSPFLISRIGCSVLVVLVVVGEQIILKRGAAIWRCTLMAEILAFDHQAGRKRREKKSAKAVKDGHVGGQGEGGTNAVLLP